MVSNPNTNPTFTVEEYLALEAKEGVKYEYLDGEIYLMTGGTLEHSAIIHNLNGIIYTQLRQKPCRGFESNMRVQVTETRYVYPDFIVVCDEPKLSDTDKTMLTNPTIVAEVLSASSKHRDLFIKLDLYRSLDSLQAYLIVEQKRARVMLYTRHEDGWLLRDYIGLDAIVPLKAINCELALSDLYETVTLDEAQEDSFS